MKDNPVVVEIAQGKSSFRPENSLLMRLVPVWESVYTMGNTVLREWPILCFLMQD